MEAEIELRTYHNMITSNRTFVLHIKIVLNHPFHSLSFSLASWTVLHVLPTMTLSSISAFSYPSVFDSFTGENGRLLQRNTLCEGVKMRTVLDDHSWAHTSRSFCVAQVQSTTAPSQVIYLEYISYNLMRSGPEPSTSKPCLSESFLSEITFPENHTMWGVFSLLLLRWFFDLDIDLTRLIHKTHAS